MTFSIVARCETSRQLGVAAVTAMPAVGKLVCYAWPGAGAVATQARVNPYLGIDGVRLLREGMTAAEALQRLKSEDPRFDLRQVALVDASGRTAAWTGSGCPDWAGDLSQEGFSVQGNRLAGPQVLEATARAFVEGRDLPLVDRLMAALEAGVAMGGDTKGEHSANVYVVDTEEYPLWDIRVDEHRNPIGELRRLYKVVGHQLLPQIKKMSTRANPAGEHGEEVA
jgi:uncharacterized Ntn-hydrolase superfamily protein